ncbi:uncharacterized [Lates japonicus]
MLPSGTPRKLDHPLRLAYEHSSWLLRSQPEERTERRTRHGSSPPGRKETEKCRHLFPVRLSHLTLEL